MFADRVVGIVGCPNVVQRHGQLGGAPATIHSEGGGGIAL